MPVGKRLVEPLPSNCLFIVLPFEDVPLRIHVLYDPLSHRCRQPWSKPLDHSRDPKKPYCHSPSRSFGNLPTIRGWSKCQATPTSMPWCWDTVAGYRLREERLQEFLRNTVGNYRFDVRVCRRLVMCETSRSLTRHYSSKYMMTRI